METTNQNQLLYEIQSVKRLARVYYMNAYQYCCQFKRSSIYVLVLASQEITIK